MAGRTQDRDGAAQGSLPGVPSSDMRRLRAYVQRRVASPEDSEDILQEVLLALFQRRNLGDMVHDAAAWLFGAAAHKIVDFYRRKERRTLSLEGAAPGSEASDLWDLADASVDGPDEALEREEFRKGLAKAIDALPPDQRRVFVQHEIEGVPFRVLAERTGVPVNTLLSRKRYAVLRLRRALAARSAAAEAGAPRGAGNDEERTA